MPIGNRRSKEPTTGPRPVGRGAPRERHFGFSGRYLRSAVANDNEASGIYRVRQIAPWIVVGLAFVGVLSAIIH